MQKCQSRSDLLLYLLHIDTCDECVQMRVSFGCARFMTLKIFLESSSRSCNGKRVKRSDRLNGILVLLKEKPVAVEQAHGQLLLDTSKSASLISRLYPQWNKFFIELRRPI